MDQWCDYCRDLGHELHNENILLRAVAEAGIQSNESLRDAIGCIHTASIRPWSKRVADFDAALAALREAEGK